MSQLTLSKSQYMKGLQCPLALWYSMNRKDLGTDVSASDQARFDAGKEVGLLARQCFPDGIEIKSPSYDMANAVSRTNEAVKAGVKAIYEAAAANDRTGTQARIDILRKVDNTDMWDLIEVKSSTKPDDHHIQDMAFQYLVFTGAGYKIRSCILMCINNKYVRQGKIDPQGLFTMHDITAVVQYEQSNTEAVADQLFQVLERKSEFSKTIGRHCLDPHECSYKNHCWKHVPEYSIFDVFNADKVEAIAQRINSYKVEDIPDALIPNGAKAIDISCYKENRRQIDAAKIRGFLQTLQYPLYYLDYETLMSAIPFYDGTRPYQQVPFQFSLHVQREPGAELQHFEFIHKEKSDPRRSFVEYLIDVCGDAGSVICYFATFERTRNKELAEDFPEYASQINAINDRVVDLLTPFKNRSLYDPKQNGSASIKYVLPAFSELSYKGLEVANGEQAVQAYMNFCKNELDEVELQKLWESLSIYCKLDTHAMTELVDILRKVSA